MTAQKAGVTLCGYMLEILTAMFFVSSKINCKKPAKSSGLPCQRPRYWPMFTPVITSSAWPDFSKSAALFNAVAASMETLFPRAKRIAQYEQELSQPSWIFSEAREWAKNVLGLSSKGAIAAGDSTKDCRVKPDNDKATARAVATPLSHAGATPLSRDVIPALDAGNSCSKNSGTRARTLLAFPGRTTTRSSIACMDSAESWA